MPIILTKDYTYKINGDILYDWSRLSIAVAEDNIEKVCMLAGKLAQQWSNYRPIEVKDENTSTT